jgi:hypothetical protein
MPAASILNRHAALVNHMADVRGVDMTAALREARLSREDWAEAVLKCVGCDKPGACDHWLAVQGWADAVPVPQTPDYCRNAGLIAALARREGECENGLDDA